MRHLANSLKPMKNIRKIKDDMVIPSASRNIEADESSSSMAKIKEEPSGSLSDEWDEFKSVQESSSEELFDT
jgi:hypothetical protein